MANPVVEQLRAQVAASTTVNQSATLLINGIADRIKAAVAESIQNGATAAELEPLTELNTALASSSTELSAAVVANTPGGPVVPPTDPELAGRRR